MFITKKNKKDAKSNAVDNAYNKGYSKGYLDGYAAGEKNGITITVKAFSHMNGDYGEGQIK